MLTLTTQAATAIRRIIDKADVPADGGLRIADDPTGQSLALSLAPVPAEEDEVLDQSGVRVFLDAKAASVLSDKTLDCSADASGKVQFGINDTAT